ncbi:MAG: phosphoglycerate kinase [Paracoccaceae bacterium]
MTIRPITGLDVKGARLLVRADLNVPMDAGKVTDATRIERFADGMRPLLAQGARLVILSHLGRPRGQVVAALSLESLVAPLADALGRPVAFSGASCGAQAVAQASALNDGEVLLCENVRFNGRETDNDPGLAAGYAALGEIYVNDAFSCAHRAHASTEAVAHLMPAFGGPLLMAEIEALTAALSAPRRPSVAIVGGAKISSKINVLKHLVGQLDAIIIGGGMANTFLFAQGAPMGKSLHEADQVETVNEIRALAAAADCRLLLPADVVCAREFRRGAESFIIGAFDCPPDAMILDAGPVALAEFQRELASARTILWNGPLGAFEIEPFDAATVALARSAAALSARGQAVSVAGGGDTVAALNKAGVAGDFSYVSAAGGAFLEWLEGRVLPGIAALERSAAHEMGDRDV